ncbi:hypothetical protein [Tateyamaria pelophila]|uniref:hypothetical protein n=1 Tax=Tateyamaria pelophila TaxID=328415 RepID=UPI001CC1A584|nr:hypothetical protein [Tateyamaria pelophila]
MTLQFKIGSRAILAGVGLSLMVSVALAETEINNPNDTINKHFAVASKLFGADEVQFHARQEGEDGSRNKVYSFNCIQKTYNELFDEEFEPTDFPLESQPSSMQPFDQYSEVAPLAAHACKQHGAPILGFEW